MHNIIFQLQTTATVQLQGDIFVDNRNTSKTNVSVSILFLNMWASEHQAERLYGLKAKITSNKIPHPTLNVTLHKHFTAFDCIKKKRLELSRGW